MVHLVRPQIYNRRRDATTLTQIWESRCRCRSIIRAGSLVAQPRERSRSLPFVVERKQKSGHRHCLQVRSKVLSLSLLVELTEIQSVSFVVVAFFYYRFLPSPLAIGKKSSFLVLRSFDFSIAKKATSFRKSILSHSSSTRCRFSSCLISPFFSLLWITNSHETFPLSIIHHSSSF
jgi:hypothetical protein